MWWCSPVPGCRRRVVSPLSVMPSAGSGLALIPCSWQPRRRSRMTPSWSGGGMSRDACRCLAAHPTPATSPLPNWLNGSHSSRWLPKTSTTCMSAPAVPMCCICTAVCITRVAVAALSRSRCRRHRRWNLQKGAGLRRRAVSTAAVRCGRGWSGSVRVCRSMPLRPPLPLPPTAMCCCRWGLPAWCIRRRRCLKSRCTQGRRLFTLTLSRRRSVVSMNGCWLVRQVRCCHCYCRWAFDE